MQRRIGLHSGSNPWLLSSPPLRIQEHHRGDGRALAHGPLPSSVRWGSWCCESGRCRSENGYFTTPGSHPTTGSTPGASAPKPPAKALIITGTPPTPPDPSRRSALEQGLPQRHRRPEAVCPPTQTAVFKGKAAPESISFLQRNGCYWLPPVPRTCGPSQGFGTPKLNVSCEVLGMRSGDKETSF